MTKDVCARKERFDTCFQFANTYGKRAATVDRDDFVKQMRWFTKLNVGKLTLKELDLLYEAAQNAAKKTPLISSGYF